MIKFSDVVEMSQKCQHEGYVVREPNYPFSLLLKNQVPTLSCEEVRDAWG